ncbi:MAG: amidase family protein [Pseudomonadota bacterium]
MDLADYANHDALGLAELVRRGEVSAAELRGSSQQAMAAVNSKINAVVGEVDPALGAVECPTEAPFLGVPFLLKDLGHGYAGVECTMGSRLGLGVSAPEDSELARRFKASGLVAVGRSNTPEFGLSGATEPVVHGACRNPWDLSLAPGGSSGGAAAAVAAGVVPIAHGSDAGGSVRIPAAWCGLVGLKPSRGRVPKGPQGSDGATWLSMHFVVTRSLRDSAAMLDALSGPAAGDFIAMPRPEESYLAASQRDPGPLKIAVCTAFENAPEIDPEYARAVEAVARDCAALGHTVEAMALPLDYEVVYRLGYELFLSRVVGLVEGLQKATGREIGSETLEAMSLAAMTAAEEMSMERLFDCLAEMTRMTVAVDRFMADWDVVLTPATSRPPVKVGVFDPNRSLAQGFDYWAQELPWYYTSPLFNVTGHPAISLPLKVAENGLPIGVQFSGRAGDDATLFRLGGQLERAYPWSAQRPPVHVAAST